MECARCREELPESTPICPTCGPIVIGTGFGSALPVAAASGLSPAAAPPAPKDESQAVVRARAQGQRDEPRKDRGRSRRSRTRPPLEAPRAAVSGPAPGPVKILAFADLIAGFALLAAAAAVFQAQAAGESGMFLGLQAVLAGGTMLVAAAGLFLLKPFGRTLQLLVAGFSILVLGSTVAGLLTLVYVGRPAMSALFQGVAPNEGDAPLSGAAGPLWTGVTGVAALFQVVSALGVLGVAVSLK